MVSKASDAPLELTPMPPADKVAAALRNGLLKQRPPAVAESRRWTAGNLLLSVLDDHEECQICFHREIDTILLPCGHAGLCARDAASLQLCPFCRTVITGRQPINQHDQPGSPPRRT